MSNQINNSEYKNFILKIKNRIQHAQLKAINKVNQEMLLLYWEIGRMILKRQEESNLGDKILHQISKDLKKEFPSSKGFSKTNLEYM